ncbi:hypothetical protein [Roseiconus lacunae]
MCETDPDKTGRLVDLLADYQVNQDQIYKSKFAFLGKGIQVRDKRGATSVSDRWFLSVHESNARRLDASSIVVSHATGRYIESWKQFLRYDGRSSYRPSLESDVTIDIASEEWKNNEDYWKQDRLFLSVPQPLRHLLRTTHGYSYWSDVNSSSGSEFLMSDKAELLECTFTKDRDITAKFSLESNFPLSMEILFSKQCDYFPIKVVRSIVLRGQKKTESILEVDWLQKNELHVPSAIRLVNPPLAPSSSKLQMEIEFDWKFGEEIQAKIDPNSKDWRSPFKDTFEASWQVRDSDAPLLSENK